MSNIVKAQHTPGPLIVKGPSKPTADTPEGGDYAILDADGQIIAETFRAVCPGEKGLRPAEANARLFAAAHALLYSAIEAAGCISACIEICDRGGYPSTAAKLREFHAAQLAVIAKATGEQP